MKQKTTFFSILVCLLCFYFSANAQQSPSCTGNGQDGDYHYTITEADGKTYLTFYNDKPEAGTSGTRLFFYGPSATGGYPANNFVAGEPKELTGLPPNGTPVYFYFVYSFAPGEKNNAANRHSFIVGDCSDSGTPNIKPEITLLPAAGGPFTAPASVLLKANATDQDGTITKVEFYNGAVKIGEATSGNADIYSIQWDNVQPGEYTITAKVTDNKFGETISNPVTVTVGGEFTNDWCGTSINGQYQWRAETIGSNVKITFHPLGEAVGGTTRLIYTKIGSSGGWVGNPPMTADGTDSYINITKPADGQVLSFYFTYNGAVMGENNSSANPESYVVGSQCAKTLPVSLIDFNSKTQSDGTVSLSWATASESNNNYFLIERSTDGKNFSELVKVPSKDGNSTARLDYQFTDKQPLNGNNYYRLSQFDNNGISTELGINTENILAINSMDGIYPNPLKENTFKITVNEQLITDFVTVSIYNISGKEIYRALVKPSFGNLQVALPQKPKPGIYIVKAGNNHSFKLLVE